MYINVHWAHQHKSVMILLIISKPQTLDFSFILDSIGSFY